MIVSRAPQKNKKRRSGFRFLFTFAVTTTMIATGGFGAFPENPLTQTFQEVIGENIPADFLQPFNSYMEVVSAPTIQPKVDSASEVEPPLDPLSALAELFATDDAISQPLIGTAIVETAVAMIAETQTQIASATIGSSSSTPILSQTPTQTPSMTALPSATNSPIPSSTSAPIIYYPTNTKKPSLPTNTPTFTPTNTPSPTVAPAGFSLTGTTVNTLTNGGAVFAFPGGTFTVNFNYTVWAASNCPGCTIQLVSGMGSSGNVGTTNCAYTGQPGISPGTSGSSSLTLTAPATAGTYDIVVQLLAQPDCATAITSYTGTTGIYQKIGQVVVNNFIVVMYSVGPYSGNLGGRSGADATCVANKPGSVGNTNVRAFISISSTDTIANMTSLSPPINSNIPIVYNGGQLIAKNWTDLLDGSINAALQLSGVTQTGWWSGSETEAGTALATTPNCLNFSSGSASDAGRSGSSLTAGTGWMSTQSTGCASTGTALLCVAGP